MKKRLISLLLTLSMVFSMVPMLGIGVSAASHEPSELFNPPIIPEWVRGDMYTGQYDDGDVIPLSSYTIKWTNVGQQYFNIAVKTLNGDPDPGEDEPGTFIYAYTTNYTSNSVTVSLTSSAGKWVKVFVQACFSDGTAKACHYYFKVGEAETASLDEPTITVSSVGKSDSLKISWDRVTGASGYKIYRSTKTTSSSFKLVNTITSGSTTSWTDSGLEADTRYYYKVKAFNSKTESDYSNRDYEWTEEEAKLSLSKSSLSLAWNSTSQNSITVTYSGSYSTSVDYGVSSSVMNNYDYEWLTVTKSGSTLKVTPKRANYSASARTATITVTSGGTNKTLTVTQAKCGESAPTIKLTRGSTTYKNGDDIGSFILPQEYMEVSITSTNVRKVYAELSPRNGDGIANCSNSSKITFDISDLEAGDYKITIFASNSSTSSDYWSQSPFSGKSMTLYFTLTGSSSVIPSGFTEQEWKNITNYTDLDDSFENNYKKLILTEYQDYVIDAIKYHIENEYSTDTTVSYRTAKNLLGKNSTPDGNVIFFFDGVSTNLINSQAVVNGFKKNGTTYNLSAVCIVVRLNASGRPVIVFASQNSSTMADIVRTIIVEDNGNEVWRPILVDGAYSIQTCTHKGFASLRVQKANAVRCSPTSYKVASTSASTGIDLHCRWRDGVTTANDSWQNSTGCYTIGLAIDNDKGKEYSDFIYAVTGFGDAVSYPNGIRKYSPYTERYSPLVNYNTQKFVYSDNTTCGMMIVDRYNYKEQLEVIYGGSEKSDAKEIVDLVIANSRRWHAEIGKTEIGNNSPYTITYNYNYDGGPIKTETKNHGKTYTISETIIPTCPQTETSTTITTYRFLGWATSEDGNVVYQPGDTYTQNSNLTLYAQWSVSKSEKPHGEVTVTTYEITGTVTSYGDTSKPVTVTLYGTNGTVVDSDSTTNGSYSLSAPEGTYILEVSKTKHCTREYTIIVSDSNVEQDVEIWLYGDVYTADGGVSMVDATQIQRYLSGKSSVFGSTTDTELEKYRLKVADIYTADGGVSMVDATQIQRYLSGKSSIFNTLP